MTARPLRRTWLVLAVLSALGTALALVGWTGAARHAAGLAILALAFVKARLILLDYMGLSRALAWRGGAVGAVAAAALLFAGLYLAG